MKCEIDGGYRIANQLNLQTLTVKEIFMDYKRTISCMKYCQYDKRLYLLHIYAIVSFGVENWQYQKVPIIKKERKI